MTLSLLNNKRSSVNEFSLMSVTQKPKRSAPLFEYFLSAKILLSITIICFVSINSRFLLFTLLTAYLVLLLSELLLNIKIRVMLLDNLWIKRDLVNSTLSTIWDLIWQITISYTTISHASSHVILIKFDKLLNESDVSVNINEHYYISFFAITREFTKDSESYERT